VSPKRKTAKAGREIPALRVRQWLPEWEEVKFGARYKAKPPEHFYVSSVNAAALRALCGIERRDVADGSRRRTDVGIQRRHDDVRSKEIGRFVRHGYPWSVLGKRDRESGEFDDLKNPGWLPSAIVVNIRTKQDEVGGSKVDQANLIEVSDGEGGTASLGLPTDGTEADWQPEALHPMEVIDGQHRLWAFEAGEGGVDFELPVVAFVGLDRSWQAYLFWTINIKPKRINASLAFDLYPLLRDQDWLERFEGPEIYRQTRAQELTELLWAHEESPWHRRINMLGESGNRDVRQAAWVRSLVATFVKSWEGPRVRIGGLFGAPAGKDKEVLDWSREQQAAFLFLYWQELETAVLCSKDAWAKDLRHVAEAAAKEQEEPTDVVAAEKEKAPFAGRYTLLSTDQGVRGVLYLANDLCYLAAEDLGLEEWRALDASEESDEAEVSVQLKEVRRLSVAALLREIAEALASFDWRTSATPGLSDEERLRAAAFRGSSGYRELRRQLLIHLESAGASRAARLATDVRAELKLD
jgi:DGQHR domain-containing protein